MNVDYDMAAHFQGFACRDVHTALATELKRRGVLPYLSVVE